MRPPPPRPPLPEEQPQHPVNLQTPSPCSSLGLRSYHGSLPRKLEKESSTLKTLSSFRRSCHDDHRPFPSTPLEPFPFVPADEPPTKRKIPGKVPKPSKFQKGEMYHSDYDSDWGEPIKPTWRPYHSDTEDLEPKPRFRSVTPKLKTTATSFAAPTSNTSERRPSPPCPHQWESHEDIEKMELSLKRNQTLVQNVLTSKDALPAKKRVYALPTSQMASQMSFSRQTQSMERTHNLFSKERAKRSTSSPTPTPPPPPPPLPKSMSPVKMGRPASCSPCPLTPRTIGVAPTLDSSSAVSDHSSAASTLVKKKKKFISVREKAKMLEEKVTQQHQQQQQFYEDTTNSEDTLKEDAASETSNQRSTPTIRPDQIPGAVRVLPPSPAGSRCASADLFGHASSRSKPASPMTLPTRSHLKTNSKWWSKKMSQYSSHTIERHHNLIISDQGFSSMDDCPPTIELEAFRNNESQPLPSTKFSTFPRPDNSQDKSSDSAKKKSAVQTSSAAKSFNTGSSDYESDFDYVTVTPTYPNFNANDLDSSSLSKKIPSQDVPQQSSKSNEDDLLNLKVSTTKPSTTTPFSNSAPPTPIFRPKKFIPAVQSPDPNWNQLDASGPIMPIWRPPSSSCLPGVK